MIRPGKIESLVLTEKEVHLLRPGNYVLYEGQVAIIDREKSCIRLPATGTVKKLTRDQMSMLKRIVVTLTYGRAPGKIEVRRFPLKYEQWQRTLESRLLDSGSPVSFEVIKSFYVNQHDDSKITTFIAILVNGYGKYAYSEGEVQQFVNNAMYHAVSHATLDIEGALIIEQEEIDRWWEYNRFSSFTDE